MDRVKRTIIKPKQYMTELLLIEKVRDNPPLWDDSLPEYRDRDLRKRLWNQVASGFVGGSPKDVQKIWDQLRRALSNKRNTFAKKYGASGSEGAVYVPYTYEKEMSFLDRLRGDDQMQGNLDSDVRIDNISDELGVDIIPHCDGSEDEEELDNPESALQWSMQMEDCSPIEYEKLPLQGVKLNFQSPDDIKCSGSKSALTSTPGSKSLGIRKVAALGNPNVQFSPLKGIKNKEVTFKVDKENVEPSIKKRAVTATTLSSIKSPKKKNGPTADLEGNQIGKVTLKNNMPTPKTASPKKAILNRANSILDESECSEKPILTPAALKQQKKRAKQEELDRKREAAVRRLEEEVNKAEQSKKAKYTAQKDNEKHLAQKGCCSSGGSSPLEELIVSAFSEEQHPRKLFLLSLSDSVLELPQEKYRLFQHRTLSLVSELELGCVTDNHMKNSETFDINKCESRFQLTQEQMVEVKEILATLPDDRAIVLGDIMLYGRDILKLQGEDWLNDQIINAYFTLICMRSQECLDAPSVICMDTFFLVELVKHGYDHVKEWGSESVISTADIMLVPVFKSHHWTLIVADLNQHKLTYCDSKEGQYPEGMKALMGYLQKKTGHIWWNSAVSQDMPRQKNVFDCGVFVCMYANYTSIGREVNFVENDMPHLRMRIVHELGSGRLHENF